MHPFGGTPICPRCNKAVYAAEQAMGPGRKPCLACKLCNKRLDSYTLLEHDQENFGTRDLRQANLPHREDNLGSPNSAPSPLPISPVKTSFSLSRPPAHPTPIQRNSSRSPAPSYSTGSGRSAARSPPPVLRANSTLPSKYNKSPITTFDGSLPGEGNAHIGESAVQPSGSPVSPTFKGTPTHSGRGLGGLPRTVPFSPTKTEFGRTHVSTVSNGDKLEPSQISAVTLGRSSSSTSAMEQTPKTSPLKPTATGTRYGMALSGAIHSPSPSKQWGGTNPICPRCGKSVYFAEQMKAVGKTWHKGCLRCTECNTSLDSTKLTEKDGDPFCHRCYSKLHGPQGSGYALLGKAGG
ncbi:hypothetical protein SERLADRAFT_453022 [Serpula lacrymans var. lacrymans S7.9]|uniref:LIM zinc-binding domain-containing protein n=1 Tax=Serpula lacrymans var. lacrymans (strain S7.9) TaxID=578457 RepID=F8P9L7_SERL9|nr:uncharacterized protein SERLADRAFT_453022 [Serpula lacrymans var. lacrymans S7.9]EGO20346.1 hypothetical protein SERLADRAFT_453022 [Serpula lacrymans var. lacrymans S7.9]